MGLITETQVDMDEANGHRHDGTNDNGAVIRSETPLTNSDDTKSELKKYYGFKISESLWHICRVNIKTAEVVYSKSEDNPQTNYSDAWNQRKTLTFTSWVI